MENQVNTVQQQYRLNLKLREKRAARVGLPTEHWTDHIPGLMEGNDWSQNSDGSWFIPAMDLPTEELPSVSATYEETFRMDGLQVTKCETPADETTTQGTTPTTMIQSDTGANACITADLTILRDVQWVKPVGCESAKKGATLEIQAIGKYLIRGTSLSVNMYYCPDAHNTIISPTAIVRQHRSRFVGYQKYVNVDRNRGHITIIARDNEDSVNIPLHGNNDLWFHAKSHTIPLDPTMPSDESDHSDMVCQPCVNRLSDAAQYELWHQRLAHTGTKVMEMLHKDADGVPKLRGNAFFRCPSCMSNKLCTKLPGKHKNLGARTKQGNKMNDKSDSMTTEDRDDDDSEILDDIHLPEALPGQHFHIDFGFVRGSDYRLKQENAPTVTSIDGKNSYCLIVDRATRYMWIYLSGTKEPPVEPVRMILRKFGSQHTHRTVRTDQDKSLGKSVDFVKMLKDEKFTLELTGTDSSQQNSLAERPHRDLAQMMRCMLFSAELSSAYWSYALTMAVYIKNRLPHSALSTTPFQAFTGRRPDLSRLRIFGSRVYARKSGERAAKLDNHTAEGIFLGFTATDANVYFIDDETGTIKTGQHVIFDEAHMTVPAGHAPLAAQALQRLGYYVKETWVDEEKKAEMAQQQKNTMQFCPLTETAKIPTCGSDEAIGFDLFLDLPSVTVEPGQVQLLPTGISARPPHGSYLRIAPRSGLTVKQSVDTLAGVVDPDFTGNITVVMYNFGITPKTFARGDKIAQLIVENATIPEITIVQSLDPTARSGNGFGSTDVPKVKPVHPPVAQPPMSLHDLPQNRKPPDKLPTAAAAATLETTTQDLHLVFRQPYNIDLSDSPLDNQTFRQVQTFGDTLDLGFDIQVCKKFGLPQVIDVRRSTPAARLPRWRSELRNAYITSVNGQAVSTIQQIKDHIHTHRTTREDQPIEIGFATITKHAMHPQEGVPQLYHDQLNILGSHLWQLKYDPEWNSAVEEALPLLEVIKSGEYENIAKEDQEKLLDVLHVSSLKKQRKLTRQRLQKLDEWPEWQQSEFKQLDQYRDQNTFGEPEPRPKGANLLSLLWCYLVKDDGRKKARCVCNGSKNMRGTVTLAETYAASLEQTASRVFWAATAINNFITIGADASNAFAEAPAPVAPLYVYVDEQFRQWYRARYPNRKEIPPGFVLRVKKALQGHPESPRLWAQLIDKIIHQLNLNHCKHEPNLYFTNDYRGTGKTVLFMKQVDDFAVSCEDRETAQAVILAINEKMTIDVKELGLLTRFNGVDVTQTRHYIKLSNAVYIQKILKNHPWLNDDPYPPAKFPLPLKPDAEYAQKLETATPFDDKQRQEYESEIGFTYRQGIGEVIYALVTCRPDISFAAIKLSQYSAAPARIHFDALQDLFRYLKATQDDGIYFWRQQPRNDLPLGPTPNCKEDNNYSETVVTARTEDNMKRLGAAVDSDHAGDTSHRKSVSGIVIKLAGGAVLYKTAFQQTIAHSSTESEFVAACEAGKYILYLRSLLDEIGISQEAATILYEDNQGALLMANAQRPTRRTRHLDLKYFGLQEWVQRDLIILHRINTSDNYADAMTKALARTLFYRHMNFIMGRIVPAYAYAGMNLVVRRVYDKTTTVDDRKLRFLSREGVTSRFHIPIGLG